MNGPCVRIAQVGIGYWGKNLLRNFLAIPGVEVAAICDRDAEVRRQYRTLRSTDRFEDILGDSAIDAVVIATETPLHFPMAEAALLAGKHVFVEKPMAQKADEAERLVRLAEERGRHLMVGHLLLYHPAFRYVEDMIRRGDLGRVYYLYSVRVNLGIIRQRENALESLAPHDLSVALAFLNQEPVAVATNGMAYLQQDIADVAFATVFFDGGALAHLHTSWLDPHKIRKVTVVGSRKMAVIDDGAGAEKVRLYDKGVVDSYDNYGESLAVRSGDIYIPRIAMQEPLRLECSHFADCIRTGKTPRTDGRNGLAVVRILEAAQRSLREGGRRVSLT